MLPIHITLAQNILRGLLIFFTISLFYYLLCLILPLITVNNDALIKRNGIIIFIAGDDMHTEIIMPIKNEVNNWDDFFDAKLFNRKSSESWISVGFAEKNFYTDNHSWGDMNYFTGFKAMVNLGSPIMHVAYESEYPFNRNFCRRIYLSKAQYQSICRFVKESFETESGKIIPLNESSYKPDERIFEASRSFHLFNTCNTWTNELLKLIHFRTGVWTALPHGIKEQFAF